VLPASGRSPAVRSRARPNRECLAGQALRSPAAEDLRFLATAVSAVCGRPGFVPDEYLDELDGAELGHPGADPAVGRHGVLLPGMPAELLPPGLGHALGPGQVALGESRASGLAFEKHLLDRRPSLQ
jgi:hypothetical protein